MMAFGAGRPCTRPKTWRRDNSADSIHGPLGVTVPIYLPIQPQGRDNFVKTPLAGRANGRPAGVSRQNPRGVLRNFFSASGFVVFAALARSLPAAADTDPAEFIGSLGNQALEVLRDSTSLYQKQTFFHQLLSQDFDLSGISRFVLGPYWRVASEAERGEFQQLFEYHVMMTYGPRLADYRSQGLKVIGKRLDPLGLVVTSQILRPQGTPPIPVDWRLSVCDGLYKVSDIVIEGISMAATQRSEVAQMIQRNGGRVESLLAIMRQRR
jgi:phospholipid transport system substrate-binding protein